MNVAIRIQDVAKSFGRRFPVGRANGDALWQMWSIVKRKAPLVRANAIGDDDSDCVLSGITLDIGEGSVVALKGQSNSGKSVLLGILAGTIPVSRGRAELRGVVHSLLGGDTGLNPNLSLRETVARWRRIDGLKTAVTPEIYDQIVRFSGLQKFQDIPTRYFSSGMRLRLEAALAMTSATDILLLDDVLEVGDIEFQRRCSEKLVDLSFGETTILFASHDEELIRRTADRVVTLQGGRIVGDSSHDLADEVASISKSGDLRWEFQARLPENESLKVERVEPTFASVGGRSHVDLVIDIRVKEDQVMRPMVDATCRGVCCLRSLATDPVIARMGQRHRFEVSVPLWMMNAATVVLDVHVLSTVADDFRALKSRGLMLIHKGADEIEADAPPTDPQLAWRVESLAGSGP